MAYSKVQLKDVEIPGESAIDDIVATEMVKISLIKVNILRTNLFFSDLTTLCIKNIANELHEWNNTLPAPLILINVVYNTQPMTFQAYTACTIVLHVVAQKQLHGVPAKDLHDHWSQADKCLAVLRFCSDVDPMAFQFYHTLSQYFDALQDAAGIALSTKTSPSLSQPATTGAASNATLHTATFISSPNRPTVPPSAQSQRDDYLVRIPDPSSPTATFAFGLIDLLCHPLKDPQRSNDHATSTWAEMAGGIEPAGLAKRLDQRLEVTSPFDWRGVDGVRNDGMLTDLLGSVRPGRFWGEVEGAAWG
ncbi:hypothetical protein M8818_004267 [Zalaria obscura]|uniref:Uncharacterized protein n=1 Tax=Zalaria obscura TaxID=2024903 RepID=A0ACC3SC71_9PEZI